MPIDVTSSKSGRARAGYGCGQRGLRDVSDGHGPWIRDSRGCEAQGNLPEEPGSTPAGQDPAKLRVIF
jgi:hypothetical protein